MDERNDYNSIPITAVEWLFLMLNNPNRDQEFANKLLEQAKQMEKEQIIIAHDQRIWPTPKAFDDGEEYYNQTYNNENTNGTSIS